MYLYVINYSLSKLNSYYLIQGQKSYSLLNPSVSFFTLAQKTSAEVLVRSHKIELPIPTTTRKIVTTSWERRYSSWVTRFQLLMKRRTGGVIIFLEVDTVTIEDENGGLGGAARIDAAEVAAVISSNDGNGVTGSKRTTSG